VRGVTLLPVGAQHYLKVIWMVYPWLETHREEGRMAMYIQRMMASMVTLTFFLSSFVIANIVEAQPDSTVFKGSIKSKSRQHSSEPFKVQIKSHHEEQVNAKPHEGSISIKAAPPGSEPSTREMEDEVVKQPGATPLKGPLPPPGQS
jgi:hypothetical protein